MSTLRQCVTSFGKSKKIYTTFEGAVKAAHKMNKNPKTIWAQEAYKCHICYKFHTGRNKHNIQLHHTHNIYSNEK